MIDYWNLEYFPVVDHYILEVFYPYESQVTKLFNGRAVMDNDDVNIEKMVDIRDAIFTSGADIQSARGGRRWFFNPKFNNYCLREDNNVFIIKTNSYNLMMVDEERIYMGVYMDKFELDEKISPTDFIRWGRPMIDSFLRRAKTINPDYFGGCLK